MTDAVAIPGTRSGGGVDQQPGILPPHEGASAAPTTAGRLAPCWRRARLRRPRRSPGRRFYILSPYDHPAYVVSLVLMAAARLTIIRRSARGAPANLRCCCSPLPLGQAGCVFLPACRRRIAEAGEAVSCCCAPPRLRGALRDAPLPPCAVATACGVSGRRAQQCSPLLRSAAPTLAPRSRG